MAKVNAPETLTRTGKWVVNYDGDACHLLAQFGTDKDILAMRLTRYEPGEAFHLSLYGRKLASDAPRIDADVDFGLAGAPVRMEAVTGQVGKLPLLLFGLIRLDGWEQTGPDETGPSLSPRQEAAVSGVTVKIERKRPFRLEFGSLAKPMEQLRTCQADLLKSWGYDPVVQTTLTKQARPANAPATWLKAGDYPGKAREMGQNGIVQFRLDVDAAGNISGCHVLARTKPDVFADATCRAVTRRAKLDHALDVNGKPVPSFYVQRVRWQMTD
ncbi:MAG TPA: energy transducer TonB [Sphingomonadaceae bacterium]|nr:energy transducer TonB [Sphingomonadaceae bacterium]